MENLNNVPSSGTFGGSINQVNHNFGLVKDAIDGLEGRTIRSKGLFPTQAALIAAYPSPKVGDYAYVGSSLPATIYDCEVEGTWHNTQQQGGSESVPLNNYPTKSEMNAAIEAIEIETVDNLNEETAASGKALDAHQGFVLAGQIGDVEEALNEIDSKFYTNGDELFKWNNSDCGGHSWYLITNTNETFRAVGNHSNDTTDNSRIVWFDLFKTSFPLEEGKTYKISFDYSYKKSVNTKTLSVGLSSNTTSIQRALFNITAIAEETGLHYELEMTYSTYGRYIILRYTRQIKDDYFEITNVSVTEKKIINNVVFENKEDISNLDTRLGAVEEKTETKYIGLELFDIYKSNVSAVSTGIAYQKDVNNKRFKFTSSGDYTTGDTRYDLISLPDNLIVGNAYKISFEYTTSLANSSRYADIRIQSASGNRIIAITGSKTGSANYTYVHATGNTRILFGLYHPNKNDYIEIRNLSIRFLGKPQEVVDNLCSGVEGNSESIKDIQTLMEKNNVTDKEDGYIQWYNYSGNKMLCPNRAGIETIISYISTGSGDYSGFPQGFSIWGDYAIGYNAGMPQVIVFNIKERRKVGQFSSGLSGTVASRHCNSVDFTNTYYEEGDEFPLLYVSGNENRNDLNLIGVDYLMRIKKNGDSFTSTLIQTITVRNTVDNAVVYHNTAIDRRTGKILLRNGSNLFAVDLPSFKDSETGERIPTAEILIDRAQPTVSIEYPTPSSTGYGSPQGGCVHNGIAYFAYGATGQPKIMLAVNVDNGSVINEIFMSEIGYELEVEDIAFWGKHMIIAGGGSNKIYEVHWE